MRKSRSCRVTGLVGALALTLTLTAVPASAITSGTLVITSDTTLTEDHAAGFVNYGIRIAADGVTLDCAGHTVAGVGGVGHGIHVQNRTGVTIRNCFVTGFTNGIVLLNSSGSVLDSNVTYSNDNAGVALAGAHGNTLAFNESNGNGNNGFQLSFSSENTLMSNTASGNQGTGGFAMGGDANHLIENRATGNALDGFNFGSGSGNVFEFNGSVANGSHGFAVNFAEGNTFTGNVLTGNGSSGFVLNGASGNTVTGNTANDNGGSGFRLLAGSSGNAFRDNTARRDLIGVELYGSSENVFARNRFIDNGRDGCCWGVWVADGSNENRFVGNVARGSAYENFTVAFGSTGNELIGNVSRDSDYEGISLYYGADHNVVRGNTVTGNATSGVLVYDSSHNTIANNTVVENNLSGAADFGGISVLAYATDNLISGNRACHNGNADGLDDGTGARNVWEANTFCSDLVVLSTGECVEPPSDLTAWWTGDATANDAVGGHRGTLVGDTTYADGVVDEAFTLDGDGDFVDVADDPALDLGTGDFTVDLWVNFATSEGEQVLVEKYIETFDVSTGSGWSLTKLEDNTLLLALGQAGGVATEPLDIPVGEWMHVAATRADGMATLFIDGEEAASNLLDDPAHSLDTTSSLRIGHRGSPTDTSGSLDERGFYLNGRIDEVELVVGRALSVEEIAVIYAAGADGKCKE